MNNKTCPQCGTLNDWNATSCIKCGAIMQPSGEEQTLNRGMNIESQAMNNDNRDEAKIIDFETSRYQNDKVSANNDQTTKSAGNMNYFSYILGAILKPSEKYKQEEQKLNTLKNVLILFFIVVGLMILSNLISVVFYASQLKSYYSVINHANYFNFIWQYFLLYGGALLAISGVYYIMARIIKQKVKYIKLLGATTTAFIPLVIAYIISPLLSMIYEPSRTIVTIIGIIYSFIVLLELTNRLISIDSTDKKIHVQVVCLSTIIIGGGWIVYKLLIYVIGSILGIMGSMMY